MEKSLRNYWTVFFTFLKISLFTFGGGYTMISLLQNELVGKKKWIEEEEFLNVVAVAESTPGPIAINCATYVGHKLLGFWGSLIATIAIAIPSFVIIYLISLFLDEVMKIELVQKAFKGIKAAVAVLIIAAGIRMLKKSKKSIFMWVLFVLTFAALTLLNLFSVSFSAIYAILCGAVIGLCFYSAISLIKKKKKGQSDSDAVKESEDDIP